MSDLTAERLRELLHYDPETGVFTWRVDRQARKVAGEVAGWDTHGYVSVQIDCRTYRAHRLAFLYMEGQWPRELVDHIDGCRSNNVWANIRPATRRQNNVNVGLRKDNTSGYKGVTWNKRHKAWTAQIWVGGRRVCRHGHATAREAAETYKALAEQEHGEFVNLPGFARAA